MKEFEKQWLKLDVDAFTNLYVRFFNERIAAGLSDEEARMIWYNILDKMPMTYGAESMDETFHAFYVMRAVLKDQIIEEGRIPEYEEYSTDFFKSYVRENLMHTGFVFGLEEVPKLIAGAYVYTLMELSEDRFSGASREISEQAGLMLFAYEITRAAKGKENEL